MSRPMNETVGKPLRTARIPVQVTYDEKDELARAAEAAGMGVSTYIRMKALDAARREAS